MVLIVQSGAARPMYGCNLLVQAVEDVSDPHENGERGSATASHNRDPDTEHEQTRWRKDEDA